MSGRLCIHALSDKHTGSMHLSEIGVAIAGWEGRTCSKGGQFSSFMFMFSLVHLGTTRNYIAVEEKFSGFVLVSIGKSAKGGH